MRALCLSFELTGNQGKRETWALTPFIGANRKHSYSWIWKQKKNFQVLLKKNTPNNSLKINSRTHLFQLFLRKSPLSIDIGFDSEAHLQRKCALWLVNVPVQICQENISESMWPKKIAMSYFCLFGDTVLLLKQPTAALASWAATLLLTLC